jgi:hypothetical protein
VGREAFFVGSSERYSTYRAIRAAHIAFGTLQHMGPDGVENVGRSPGETTACAVGKQNARIIPLLLRIVPRLQREFPNVRIQLRADAGFATPLLYEFCEFFGIQYNNSPLLVKREYWYSPLLGINLSGSRSDPRFGTQNFEVTDVVIGEPDAKLFAVPSGSKMINLKSPAGTGEPLQAPQSN